MSQINLQFKASQKTIMFLLGVIIFVGIGFRLIFSHFELPLNSDNLQYFLYAIDHSLGETVNSFKIHNTGWPLFLSFFFSVFTSNNYMDFMALQKIISIVISSLTAIPIYFLGKKFFTKELALLGSVLFVFEPRIVQNSTFGISDPLYIIGITIAITLLLNSRKNSDFIAFAILGLSIAVRSEGLFLIPAFVIVYFWQKKISKESLGRILISLLIISLVLSIITYHRNLEDANNNIFSRIESGVGEIYTSPETKSSGSPINLLIDGFINFVKFLGWSQIPIWIIFVPAGFVILLISRNKNTGVIFTLLFFISLPTLYAFSFSNDTRYLFPLYPLFSVLSLYFLNKINQNKKKFTFIKIGIVTGLIVSSSLFLIWKDVDAENEQRVFELVKEISDNEKIVNNYGYEASYTIPAALDEIQIFPITSNEIKQYSTKIINIPRLDSLEEFMNFGIENHLTHWIIKEKNNLRFLDEIYENEEKYPFLINDYEYWDERNIKIFRVNYDKYELP
jgi:4-amino-4-deoxy-L-arabinose transferase-like glycosyltransferase